MTHSQTSSLFNLLVIMFFPIVCFIGIFVCLYEELNLTKVEYYLRRVVCFLAGHTMRKYKNQYGTFLSCSHCGRKFNE